jgi:hypothetical protein
MLPFTFEIVRWAARCGAYVRSNRDGESAAIVTIVKQRKGERQSGIEYLIVVRLVWLLSWIIVGDTRPST